MPIYKLNWEVNMKILEEAYKFLRGLEFSGCDPVELLSLLTDYEVNHIGDILKNVIRPTLDRMKDFGTEELIPILKGKKIEHGNPGLDWGRKQSGKTV